MEYTVEEIKSLSARRAWIEMGRTSGHAPGTGGSLSARRAWIEIGSLIDGYYDIFRRSPQGERGLKLLGLDDAAETNLVALRQESVD